MSLVPERDCFSYQFRQEQLDKMWEMSERIELFYSDANHEDQCNCDSYPLNCLNSMTPWGYSVSAYEAIMYLVSTGALKVEELHV